MADAIPRDEAEGTAPGGPGVEVDTAPAAPRDEAETAPVAPFTHADVDAARLEILRALEREELDVETAADRLAALEGLAREEA